MESLDTAIDREIDRDSFRQNLIRFTWQAYHLIPPIPEPSILDLGCGTGVPTIELAVLSRGRVTAVDRDPAALARLRAKVDALNLRKRIRIVRGDIERWKARPGSFDIVWSEGAVVSVGFERAIGLWRAHLKADGFLVVHDEIKDRERKLASLAGLGFALVSHFILPVDTWLTEYFRPLGGRLHELAAKYADQPEALAVLRSAEGEIEEFKKRPDDFSSVFYIMKRSETARRR